MTDLAALETTRQTYRTKLATALTDDEDPLAEYERFVKWTIESYPPEHIPKSGLLELLEEATRQFKDDDVYKSDLRYTKLWMLYAAYVDDERTHAAVPIYKYLVKNSVGMAFAQVYEEYAAALERADRADDAKQVFLHGIKRKARPVERLKKRYAEFQARVAGKKPPPSRASTSPTPLPPTGAWKGATPDARAIRRDPLKNFKPKDSAPTSGPAAASTSASASTTAPAYPTAEAATASDIPANLVGHPALTKHGHLRYLPMLLPTPPGKRPEKLRFNLAALFTDDGIEYSVHEARARSLGLLGKQWAPPPPSERRTSAAAAGGGAPGRRNATVTRKGGFYAEPTVTLATKEALADVFGMYNSPEKSMRFGPATGSKYAPVRKIEPVTPGHTGGSLNAAFAAAKRAEDNAKTPVAVFRDENVGANAKTPIAVFRDENAGAGRNARENGATPGASKFQVFIDPSNTSQTPRALREGRRALSAKDPATPVSNENAKAGLRARPAAPAASLGAVSEVGEDEEDEPTPPARQAEKKEERPSFSVFSAAVAAENAVKPKPGLSKKEIFMDAPLQASSSKAPEPAPEQPFRVFSRPPAASKATSRHNENAQRKPFTPFRDTSATPNPPPSSAPTSSRSTPAIPAEAPAEAPRVPFGERSHTPLQAYSSSDASTDSSDADGALQYQMPVQGGAQYYDDGSTQSSDLDDDTEAPQGNGHAVHPHAGYADDTMSDGIDERMLDARTPGHSDADDYDYDYEYDDEDEPQPGSGHMHEGRLGKLNLMTPITERTLEFTSTRTLNARSTGGSMESAGGKIFTIGEEAARESADMLAAELRGDEGQDAPMADQTGQLGLTDALARASSFAPPNPCNPFDGAIVAAMLAMLPADPAFHDLRAHDSGRLDALQKFARRLERRSSGNTSRGSSGGAADGALRVELADRRFDVVAKLGEGGFGAVFEAVDVNAAALRKGRGAGAGADSDLSDLSEDEDDDEVPRVALKVVRPRSIWEFHVLRRIHAQLSPALRRSIVAPAALYAFRDESFLVLELRRQGTLLDVVNRAAGAGITQPGACLDELLVVFFAVELMRTLEGLHRAGFVHGDVKIDNCLLRLEDVPGPPGAWAAQYDAGGGGGWACKGVTLIDFGRTLDTALFPAGQAFVGDWATDARDCAELREGRPWTFQPDYFGLAGVLFCMLYGRYIEAASVVPAGGARDGRVRYKLATPFKRYWQGELWARMFDLLLNPTLVRADGALPLCDEMAELRAEMERWLEANCNRASNSLKGLLKKVGLSVLGGKDGR
ncbi:Mad3/BUB1 homology region 1-domain-containing protein [Phanerochaete sordida]|uniref:Mad3/BUB1 homology region 1-domain-containing protein n=1 Tax=Phanerochaete sordida TaxID=48140 RepID=A0A9P3LC85_9APHY|nr:Mad3/BUB1 homology region 1-domain-containing protein [Phanerochaete sordida]